MDLIKNGRRTVLVCVLLSAVTLAAYWPVFHNDFIKLDDRKYVIENPHVFGGLTWDNVKWAFESRYASNWHPLTWLSHMLDVQLFGLKPAWHHGVNLLFHIANSLLLFLLLKRTTGALWRSATVAALFALHPLHVESVAWVAERKDVLSTFFFMLTLLAYAAYVSRVEGRGSKDPTLPGASNRSEAKTAAFFYALTLFLFALGLMSKPMLVTLPFVLLLLDFWPLRRFNPLTLRGPHGFSRRLLWEKIPFLALAFASCVLTYAAQHAGHAVSTFEGIPLESRIDNALVAYTKYLDKTIWPVGLSIFYPHPALAGTKGYYPDWQVFVAACLLAALSIGAIVRVKREPWLAAGWFWFLGTLVPVVGVVQVGGQSMADRYSYVPLIGIFICAVWAAGDALAGRKLGRLLLGGAGLAAVGVCAAVSHHQLHYWKDDLTVFEHALAVDQHNSMALQMVGVHLSEQGKYDQAAEHFQAALQAYPEYADARYGLAMVLAEQGKTQDAIDQLQAAIRMRPYDVWAHNGLGAVYWQLGRIEEAAAEYTETLRLDPDFVDAHSNLGTALLAQGKPEEATAQFAEAVRLRPGNAEALSQWAKALVRQGKLGEAEAQLRQVIPLLPTNAPARINLANLLVLEAKTDEAKALYSEAIRLEPKRADAHRELGKLLIDNQKFAEASDHLAEAVRLEPDYAEAHTGLARALAAQGKLEEAVAQFREAAHLGPTNAQAALSLGNALMVTGHTNEAATAFANALRLEPDLAQKSLESGKTSSARGELNAALASFATAVWLKPDSAEAHEEFGLLLARTGKIEDAISHFQEGLRLRPDAKAYYNLGLARVVQGKPAEAISNYRQAIALTPDWADALNDLAWLLATCHTPEVRSAAEAIRLAERACELSAGKEPRYCGTLAAAYAEAGRFDDAVRTAEKAKDLALAAGQRELADRNAQLLELYRSQKPYHDER
jgi:tetratricopeptide (TPR) repeat protein